MDGKQVLFRLNFGEGLNTKKRYYFRYKKEKKLKRPFQPYKDQEFFKSQKTYYLSDDGEITTIISKFEYM